MMGVFKRGDEVSITVPGSALDLALTADDKWKAHKLDVEPIPVPGEVDAPPAGPSVPPPTSK